MPLGSSRKLVASVALVLLILVLGDIFWPDGRPSVSDAEAVFEQLYPGNEVLSVQVSEDEVVARSFTIRYRKPGADSAGEIGIQFMKENSTGNWEPTPLHPDDLP